MADANAQKRVLPARDRRESAAKRRASSPAHPPPPTPTPTPRKSSPPIAPSEPRPKRKYTKRASLVRVQTPASRSSPSVSVAEEVLPTRLTANRPLPTLKEKQPADLSLKEYQSIAESAILSASLHRSRMQWLCDGVFQKYWVKPVKRKGVVEAPPNNPDVKSMQKLGSATITVEPHTFDAIFYTVRDPAAPQPQPYQRHPNQHTTKGMIPQHPPHPQYGMYPPPSPYQHSPSRAPQGSTVASPPPSNPAVSVTPALPAPSPAAPTQSQARQGPSPPNVKQEITPRTSSIGPLPSSEKRESMPSPGQSQASRPNDRPNPTPGGKGSTTDPVIQMLAARAASDSRLKELMKVVATSKASPEQLKEFQAHIDEFNEIIRKQEAERVKGEERPASRAASTPAATSQLDGSADLKPEVQPTTPNPATSVQAPTPPPPPPPAPAAPAAAHLSTYNTPSQPRQQPLGPAAGALPGVMHTFTPPPPPSGPGPTRPMSGYMGYPPPPRPEPIIKHIVLEMTSTPSGSQSASTDRWLFPEHAVLEMRYTGLEMVCSFLVERKGSDILSNMGGEAGDEARSMQAKFSADKEYYQPVTMTIKAMNHRTIEVIAKAAKPLPTVQEYMRDVMAKKGRAPVEYLVHRLPRDKAYVGVEELESGFVDSGVELGNESGSEEDELKEVYGI